MPTNKEALIRYRVINRCLVDLVRVSKQRLTEACEDALDIRPISPRTIAQDIHDMRYEGGLGFYAPIAYDRKSQVYYYEDPGYSIDKLPLKQEELDSLLLATKLLEQYRNIDIFSSLPGAVQKIQDAVDIRRQAGDNVRLDFVQFEPSPAFAGSVYLGPLIRAIRDRCRIDLVYHPFYAEEAYTTSLHPYFLRQYRHRWYLTGWNVYQKAIRTYGLDRIKLVEPCGEHFDEPGFDPAEHFRYSVGITTPEAGPMHILLKVNNPQAKYLLSCPWHESQEVAEEAAGHVVFSFVVHPSYEFISQVLSLGGEAELLEPAGLREEIRQRLDEARGRYG